MPTDLAAAVAACKHTKAEAFALAVGSKPSLPPPVLRHCPECGALHRSGKWTVPTLAGGEPAAAAIPAPLRADLHAALDRVLGTMPADHHDRVTSKFLDLVTGVAASGPMTADTIRRIIVQLERLADEIK